MQKQSGKNQTFGLIFSQKIKMKSPINYPIALALIILLAGCSLKSGSGSKQAKEVDVRVGFSGLAMEFVKNTPPQRVFESTGAYESVFPVIIRVKNIGAFSLDKDNKAVLSLGVEKDYTKSLQLLENERVKKPEGEGSSGNIAVFNLEGKSRINTKGGEEAISYNVVAGKLDPQSEAHSSTVTATLCYPYETVLSAAACIDGDIGNVLPNKKVCQVQDLVFGSGQGSPVAVTKVEVQMLPTQQSQQDPKSANVKPQFLILIENKGGGTVIEEDAVNDFCKESKIGYKDLNIVYVSASLGNEELDCTPKSKDEKDASYAAIKLKDKKELARCALKEGVQAQSGAYLSPLSIELSYGYSQSISANYFIEKVAR